MADSLIHQLQRRYPGVAWHPNGFGFRGESKSGAVFAVSPVIRGGRYSGQWIAAAAPRNEAVRDMVRDYPDAVAALEGLRQLGGEHMAALEPVDDYSRAQTPQSTPYPALLFRAAWAALWPDVAALAGLAGLMAVAMVLGWIGMWWLTGGGQ